MSTRRAGTRSRSKSRSRRDGEGSGSEPESAPEPSPAELEEEFEDSQQADGRVLERAEELEKIKKQQRQTGEGLAALRQRFEDRGAAAAAEAAEVKGLLQQLLAETVRCWRRLGLVGQCIYIGLVTTIGARVARAATTGYLHREGQNPTLG